MDFQKNLWGIINFISSSEEEIERMGAKIMRWLPCGKPDDKEVYKNFFDWIKKGLGIQDLEKKIDAKKMSDDSKLAILVQDKVAKTAANICGEIPQIIKDEILNQTSEISEKVEAIFSEIDTLKNIYQNDEEQNQITLNNLIETTNTNFSDFNKIIEKLEKENNFLKKKIENSSLVIEELKKDNLLFLFNKIAKEIEVEINGKETENFIKNFKVPYGEREYHIRRCLLSIKARRLLGPYLKKEEEKYNELIEIFINNGNNLNEIVEEWKNFKIHSEKEEEIYVLEKDPDYNPQDEEEIEIPEEPRTEELNLKDYITKKEEKIEKSADSIIKNIPVFNNKCIVCGKDRGNNRKYCSRNCAQKAQKK